MFKIRNLSVTILTAVMLVSTLAFTIGFIGSKVDKNDEYKRLKAIELRNVERKMEICERCGEGLKQYRDADETHRRSMSETRVFG